MRIDIFQAVLGSRAGVAGTWRRKNQIYDTERGRKGRGSVCEGEVEEEEGSKGELRRVGSNWNT